jgi:class 3 adenylate cyclase
MVAAVSGLKTHAPLRTRVGIATGLVVWALLSTPNFAARLQSIAEADSVVIAESTRKLVGNLFETPARTALWVLSPLCFRSRALPAPHSGAHTYSGERWVSSKNLLW